MADLLQKVFMVFTRPYYYTSSETYIEEQLLLPKYVLGS